jgi:hypothetical protein
LARQLGVGDKELAVVLPNIGNFTAQPRSFVQFPQHVYLPESPGGVSYLLASVERRITTA